MKSYLFAKGKMLGLGDKTETHYSLSLSGQQEKLLENEMAEYIRKKKMGNADFIGLIKIDEEELRALGKHCGIVAGKRQRDLVTFFATLLSV